MASFSRVVFFLVVFTLAGCQPDFSAPWLILEVSDSESQVPIVGAEVTVPVQLLLVRDELPADAPTEARLAPTDALGRTWIPIVLLGDPPMTRSFIVMVQLEGMRESFNIRTVIGDVARGERFSCRVLEIVANSPPTQAPMIEYGSNPPKVFINAYVSKVFVTSTTCPTPIFVLFAYSFRPFYMNSFVLGSVPEGFNEGIREDDCSEPIASELPRYQVMVLLDDTTQQFIESDFFCIDENGGAIPCP